MAKIAKFLRTVFSSNPCNGGVDVNWMNHERRRVFTGRHASKVLWDLVKDDKYFRRMLASCSPDVFIELAVVNEEIRGAFYRLEPLQGRFRNTPFNEHWVAHGVATYAVLGRSEVHLLTRPGQLNRDLFYDQYEADRTYVRELTPEELELIAPAVSMTCVKYAD